ICSFSFFFFSSRRRHTRFSRDWSSDVCSSDLGHNQQYWWQYADDAAMRLRVCEHVILSSRPDAVERTLAQMIDAGPDVIQIARRSEERRVGKECGQRCQATRSRTRNETTYQWQ